MIYWGKRIPENSIQYRSFRHKTDSLGCSAKCVKARVVLSKDNDEGRTVKIPYEDTLPKKEG
jgi:hypothetical protein